MDGVRRSQWRTRLSFQSACGNPRTELLLRKWPHAVSRHAQRMGGHARAGRSGHQLVWPSLNFNKTRGRNRSEIDPASRIIRVKEMRVGKSNFPNGSKEFAMRFRLARVVNEKVP